MSKKPKPESPSIEMLAPETLRAREVNPRVHPPAQLEALARSMREFGFTSPVLIDGEGVIIAGHGRVAAAIHAKLGPVPCIRVRHLTPEQVRAYVIADNKLALNAGWDEEMLKTELDALKEYGFDIGIVGFSEDEIAEILSVLTAEGATDPEEVPEAPTQPVSVPGDVWILDGRHRITCGDCTQKEVVDRVLNGVRPHLMVTDPPYGVEYDPSWRNDAVRAGNGKRGAIGARAVGKVENDDNADWREAWALFPGEVAYVWHAGLFAGVVADSLVACDFKLRSQIIWSKSNFAIGRGDYHWQHEPCWYAVRNGGTGHWSGDRKQATIWEIPKPAKSETGHGTQKPVECMRRPIENNSSLGQAVYEPFSGSGTTIIACEQTGRVCHAVELNPSYVDVAVDRWQKFTGKEAVNEATGRTFNETKAKMEGKQSRCPTISCVTSSA